MSYQFDLKALSSAREMKNYKVVDNCKSKSGRCAVFFSSNGLYYPNTEDNIKKTIRRDYYEWSRLAIEDFERVIYVRDVYKQWYVRGINETVSSLHLLGDLIQELTRGYQTTLIGSSAGGYAAIKISEKLDCSTLVIAFSPYFTLQYEAEDSLRNKILSSYYVQARDDVKKCLCAGYIIFPIFSKTDIDQLNHLSRISHNFKIIKVKSAVHGVPFRKEFLGNLLNNISRLDNIRKPISPGVFVLKFFSAVAFFELMKNILLSGYKRTLNLFKKQYDNK